MKPLHFFFTPNGGIEGGQPGPRNASGLLHGHGDAAQAYADLVDTMRDSLFGRA